MGNLLYPKNFNRDCSIFQVWYNALTMYVSIKQGYCKARRTLLSTLIISLSDRHKDRHDLKIKDSDGISTSGTFRLFFLFFLSLLLFLAQVGCSKAKKTSEEEVKPIKVQTAKPVQMTFQHKLRVFGNIEADIYADVCARIDGTIDNLSVDDGYKVSAGTILFQSDKVNLEKNVLIAEQNKKVADARIKRAKIDLELKKVEREKALSDFERAKRLINGKVISD
ncbi:MAG: hypothetical protein QXH80_00495, partial [Candidatus Nanoarchaeia archaeon]